MLELHAPTEAANWLRKCVSGNLQSDSRKLQAGDGFIAWPGAASDARQHVADALAAGAKACLVESEGVERHVFSDPRVAAYKQLKAACGPIAAAYFGHPSHQLDVLAVTGTNGKTSTVWWLAHALSNLKLATPIPCAMVGTLGIGRQGDFLDNGLTTPDPVLLQESLRGFVDAGAKACAIEASSIGIAEHRLDGCRLRTAIFTNFTQDHLDYHRTMEAYWQAKLQLFQWPGLQSAVVNIDDPKGAALATTLQSGALDLWTVSRTTAARLQASDIAHAGPGLRFTLRERAVEGGSTCSPDHVLQTSLIGTYNVSNLLGVMAAMRSIGVPLGAVIEACTDLPPVPGRMACIDRPGQPMVVIDYAHTPDALAHALLALQPISRQRGGRLWCIFGCGGDRDVSKRPQMGDIAARHADRVVVTSDNPRSEKPQTIISQILRGQTGRQSISVEPDRALAIAQSLAQAATEDVLLIAGKGHENYQEVAGQRLPFSDLEQASTALNGRLGLVVELEAVHD